MQEKKSHQDVPVRYVKGVGPIKAKVFEKIGVQDVSDLFYYLPRRYEDRSDIVQVGEIKHGETKAVVGKVLKCSTFTARTGTRIFEIAIGGPEGKVFAVWYNQHFLKKMFEVGQEVVIYGKCEKQGRLQITHPAFEIVGPEGLKNSLDVGRIVPVYPLVESLTQKYLRKIVYQVLHTYLGSVYDPLPTPVRARRKLVDSRFAVENIHFPHSPENLERAYRRLVFEEFFILQVIMALRRKKIRKKGIKHEVNRDLMDDFEKLFSFSFTDAQKKCIKDIEKDMAEEKPMYRLLQGDVGSGKTVVAMYALLLTVANGYQAAMMAPTEILARQHYVTVSQTLMPLGLNVRLLVNGISPDAKETIKQEIAEGDADIVIGTHALIQEGVEYNDLGLVVVDEQHKFGVDQRNALRSKGKMPDTLVMTATPIPRSLALTVFGDMDVSLMKEKPAAREAITTYWVDEEKRGSVYEFIRGEVKKGRQAFLVYPRIKTTPSSDLRSAEEMHEHMSSKIFPELNLSIVHGRMKSDEKDKVMDAFRKGESDILVATTVIEVGVDVPNVTVMLVEHAERYGLAQLHQLRGRIGRGKHASYCILMGDPKTEDSQERLATLAETD
ncbi:MAG: ATP-dependent DNA helicase RecG, partial [Candidatus Tantalella remota]|nr:ATP-dependent DNA helicase RecG [Candidatus Tantalella remota]